MENSLAHTPRYARTPLPVTGMTPFHSAEEAWFWFIRCQTFRHAGARLARAMNGLSRPCDPDDIYRIIADLHQQRRLSAAHLRTLSQYGLAERTPDMRCPEEASAVRLWNEAMSLMEERLAAKGIVVRDPLPVSA